MEGVIDVHYASLASRRVQHRVFHLDGHPSRYQPRPTGLNCGEQTGTGVSPLVIAVLQGYTRVYMGIHGFTRVYMGILSYTRVYRDILGYTRVYKGIHGYTRVY